MRDFATVRVLYRADIDIMSMPKTAIDHHHSVQTLHHNVGFSWQTFFVQSEAIAMRMQELTNQHFWFRIFAMDCGHIGMSLLFGQFVWHDANALLSV